ncbi:MAG: hypothetical protein IJJ06_09645 [Mogibacterium sp.]|nr:hypothetical protein [Mogibacterium sp.]
MKVDLKKINFKEIFRSGRGKHARKENTGNSEFMADGFAEADGFGAMVHSSTPILRLKDGGKQSVWKQDLLLNCSCAALMTTAFALFCMSIDTPLLILFALPCFVMYMAVATLGSIKPGPVRWIAAAVIFVILAAVAAVWHSTVLGGVSMLINQFYDVAEEAQAYIYDRLPGGEEESEIAGYIGMAWISCLIGLLTALPPAEVRRRLSGLIVILIMLAFAYYGLLPSAICIAVLIAVLIAVASRGSILSLIPVVLVALLLFGGVVLADPGENYGISRMDENFRDRFALRSTLIQTDDPFFDEEEETDLEEEEEEEPDDEESEDEAYDGEYGTYAAYGTIVLVIAALGAAAYMINRRVKRRIAENRKGIDSKDNREAVVAMFPYAIRWLKGYGIEQRSAAVISMVPELSEMFSDSYAARFGEMYKIWSEAVYSDHAVSDRDRQLMDGFMNDTIDAVKGKCKFKDVVKLRFKYAL